MYPQNNLNQLNSKTLGRIFLCLFIFGSLAIIASFTVRGKFQYTPIKGQSVYVNNHKLTSNSVWLRPATYTIKVTSARYKTTEQKIRITPFAIKTYKPTLTERPASSIISTAIGAFGYYGPPEVLDYKWFAQDTWFAAQVGPNDITPIALHYVDDQWKVVYFANPGYPADTDVLPGAVAQYIKAATKKAGVNG